MSSLENTEVNNKYRGCIAIDLGTTNSVIGYIDQNEKEVDVLNADGDLLTPSFIWLQVDKVHKTIKPLVGKQAKEKMKTDPTNVVCSYKTKMGLTNGANVVKNIMGKDLTAEVCSSYSLAYLKKSAETFLNESITRALITVPARFTEAQRHSTKLSAVNAGLDVLRLLDEPSAAAFYYLYKDLDIGSARELDDGNVDEKTVLVYDLGGGTFDISIITVAGTMCAQVGTSGDTHLGGDNFDREIAERIAQRLGIKDFESLPRNAQEKFIRLAEQAKIDISDNYYANPNRVKSATIPLDTVQKYLSEPIESINLTKEDCFTWLGKYIDTTIEYVRKQIKESLDGDISQIDEVLLVGGSSKFPLIREKMVEFLNDKRFDKTYFNKTLIDPDKAVCFGARKYMKAVLDGKEERLKTKIPNPVGIVINNEVTNAEEYVTVLSSDTTLPTRRPKQLSRPITNVFKGVDNLIFKVQEGYSKNPKDNLTLGTIRIPLSENIANNPGSALFYIQLSADEDGTISVIIKDNTPGSNGRSLTETFAHTDNGSGLDITHIENKKQKSISDIKEKLGSRTRRRRQRTNSQSDDDNGNNSGISAIKFG